VEELERRRRWMEERARRERRGGTGVGKVCVLGRSGAAERRDAAWSSRRRGRWVATGETETVGSSRKRRKRRYAAAAARRSARRHARFGGMAAGWWSAEQSVPVVR
jgi:hypothetical protein